MKDYYVYAYGVPEHDAVKVGHSYSPKSTRDLYCWRYGLTPDKLAYVPAGNKLRASSGESAVQSILLGELDFRALAIVAKRNLPKDEHKPLPTTRELFGWSRRLRSVGWSDRLQFKLVQCVIRRQLLPPIPKYDAEIIDLVKHSLHLSDAVIDYAFPKLNGR